MEKKDNQVKIFVGNVPFKCSRDEFIDCFKEKKGFVSAEVIRNVGSFTTRGFGFVVFDRYETVEELLESEIKLKDRILRLNKYMEDAEPSSKDDENTVFKLFIKNVPDMMDENKLEEIFSQFGKIHLCSILKNQTSNSGSVEFLDKVSFRSALNQKVINYEGIELKVYPFRSNKKGNFDKMHYQDLNSAYRAGFKHGNIVGYETGYNDGKSSKEKQNNFKYN
ncbi:MAG: hypothetical protein CMF62_03175 [Magnetococcales bacterium]|nr:hypothetical protein [Magnetococcales bacterium]|tara:strand:+ start:8822 stop:9487 length:666 start_codon:yes stop_codon:yes gene_type:complete